MTTRDESSPQSGSNAPQDDSGQTSKDDSAQSASPESQTPQKPPNSTSEESDINADNADESVPAVKPGEATDNTEPDAAKDSDSSTDVHESEQAEPVDNGPTVNVEFVSPPKTEDSDATVDQTESTLNKSTGDSPQNDGLEGSLPESGDPPQPEPQEANTANAPGITMEFVSPPDKAPESEAKDSPATEAEPTPKEPEAESGETTPTEDTADAPPAITVTFSSPPRKGPIPPPTETTGQQPRIAPAPAPAAPEPARAEQPQLPREPRPTAPPTTPPETRQPAPAPQPQPQPQTRPTKAPADTSYRTTAIALGLVFVLLASVIGVVAIVSEPIPERGTIYWPEYRMSDDPDPVLAALSDDAPMPDPDLLADAIAPAMGDNRLDGDLSFTVADATTGDVLFDLNGDDPLTPASSTKTLTSVAAMTYLGVDHRIATTVVEGENDNTVVIVGGGDATLQIDDEGYYHGAASLQDLADQVLEARDGESPERVVYDISLFSGDIEAPGTTSGDYAQGQTARMQALMVNGGRAPGFDPMDPTPYQRYDDPAESAAEAFADLLGADEVVEGEAPSDANELAIVHSAPMMRHVEDIMRLSDNTLSDATAFLVANEIEGEASYSAVASAQLATMEELGIPVDGITILDGSGLSRDTLITSEAFTRMLVLSSQEPHLTPVIDSLPIAGHFGSLLHRFDTEIGRQSYGNARGKTGTLNDVSSLSGSVVTAEGRQLVYSMIINDRDWVYGTQEAMDDVIAHLAACGCSQ